ncbi:hypothetical protein I4U23_026520 [Adineta vaga]|nr:hypothetical protein I4U23_026520 [Adineta vaga]
MSILHHSFSLSACPKCHLLICQHTSLADLNFHASQQNHLSDGTNRYLFPSNTIDIRYSWTTCGTESLESTQTLKKIESIPFAHENLLQSERLSTNIQKSSIDLTKSLSYSTLYDPSSQIKHEDQTFIKSDSNISFPMISLLILSFLLTNIIDIVLIYIYYRTSSFYLISFLCTIILCDIIIWINNLIQFQTNLSYFLLIPFINRFYLLYELIDFLTIAFERDENLHRMDSLSINTDSTIVDCSKKQNLFNELSTFYLIHTGLFALINFYFWSNNFQLSTQSFIQMDYFIPRWLANDDLSTIK